MKKINFIKDLSIKTGFSENYSKKLINDLIIVIINIIKTGSFNFKNVGSFKLILKKKRIGRNPKTKEEYFIKSRKSISFTSSKNLKNKLNN